MQVAYGSDSSNQQQWLLFHQRLNVVAARVPIERKLFIESLTFLLTVLIGHNWQIFGFILRFSLLLKAFERFNWHARGFMSNGNRS